MLYFFLCFIDDRAPDQPRPEDHGQDGAYGNHADKGEDKFGSQA